MDAKKGKQAGIKMLLKYVAALYVDPGETAADVVLKKFEVSAKGVLITLVNRGSKHAPLLRPELLFNKDKQKISLRGDQLKGLAGENILAGTTRQFLVPPVSGLSEDFSGQLKLE